MTYFNKNKLIFLIHCIIIIDFVKAKSLVRTSFFSSPIQFKRLVQSNIKQSFYQQVLQFCPSNDNFKCQISIQTTQSVDNICLKCDQALNDLICPCLIILQNSPQSSREEDQRIYSESLEKDDDSVTTTTPTTTSITTASHEDSMESFYTSSSINMNKSSENNFGLIMGISLTSIAFLVSIVVVLIVFLVRNCRKAKYLRKLKDDLELDLKVKQTTQLSLSTTPTATTPNSSLAPLAEFLQQANEEISSPLESDENTRSSSDDVYLNVDETNINETLSSNQNGDKLPTYNSLFSQLSNSI